jgi:hypothetical protein
MDKFRKWGMRLVPVFALSAMVVLAGCDSAEDDEELLDEMQGLWLLSEMDGNDPEGTIYIDIDGTNVTMYSHFPGEGEIEECYVIISGNVEQDGDDFSVPNPGDPDAEVDAEVTVSGNQMTFSYDDPEVEGQQTVVFTRSNADVNTLEPECDFPAV